MSIVTYNIMDVYFQEFRRQGICFGWWWSPAQAGIARKKTSNPTIRPLEWINLGTRAIRMKLLCRGQKSFLHYFTDFTGKSVSFLICFRNTFFTIRFTYLVYGSYLWTQLSCHKTITIFFFENLNFKFLLLRFFFQFHWVVFLFVWTVEGEHFICAFPTPNRGYVKPICKNAIRRSFC